MSKIKIMIAIPAIAVLLILVFGQTKIYAQTFDVSGSVQISVCGNGIAEGGEECDNQDLKNFTCKSLGFSGGALRCAIDCSYDTDGCHVKEEKKEEKGGDQATEEKNDYPVVLEATGNLLKSLSNNIRDTAIRLSNFFRNLIYNIFQFLFEIWNLFKGYISGIFKDSFFPFFDKK